MSEELHRNITILEIVLLFGAGLCVGIGIMGLIHNHADPRLARMKVEGGTIYRIEGQPGLCFVPDLPRKP